MVVCRNCYVPMVNIMSFSKDRHEKFCRCPKCKVETKHVKLYDSELSFAEVLHNEIEKRNTYHGSSRKNRVVLQ